jgi:5-methylcytosine-specific restriction protein A
MIGAADDRLSARKRGYNSRWEKARATFLASHPLCCMCERKGDIAPATVVDHVIPHRGDQKLFWDTDNWQSLCKPHHDSAKQAEEAHGYSSEVGLDGWPIDARHPANRKGRGRL